MVFDEVIMTAPLGWLKLHQEAFTPPLPLKITNAINHISYGRLEKVYITFPTAFWLSATTPATPSFFTQFLAPKYAPAQNPDSWPLECVSLASLPPASAHPTLLFYLHGPCAAHITTLTHALPPTSPTYLSALTAFFRPYYSLLPSYTPSCTPTAILATNWTHDEFAGYGSYTNFQVCDEREGVQLDRDIENLREGWPEGGVWFAGEHTAPFVALGTVTGAWWSGEGVGRRLVGAYAGGEE